MFIRKSLNPKLDRVLKFKSQPHLKCIPSILNPQKANQIQTQQKSLKKQSNYPKDSQKQEATLFKLTIDKQLEISCQQTTNSFYRNFDRPNFFDQQNYHGKNQKNKCRSQIQHKKMLIINSNKLMSDKNVNPQQYAIAHRQLSQGIGFSRKQEKSCNMAQNYKIKSQTEVRLPQVSSKFLQKTLTNLYKPPHSLVKIVKQNQSLSHKQLVIPKSQNNQIIQNKNKRQPKFQAFSPLKPACIIKNNHFKQIYDLGATKIKKHNDQMMKDSVVVRKYGKFF